MKIARDLVLIFTTCVALAFLAAPISAEDKEQKSVFVDLDGDGFNDIAEDANNDGIPDPDQTGSAAVSETTVLQVQTVNPFADLPQTPVVLPRTSWKSLFGQRRIAALGLSVNRCDFDAAFGNNDNLTNSGLGGGGACAGGVCLPR